MKKILSLFAAMLIALAANATSQTISPTTPGGEGTNLLKGALGGSADTIIMKAGTYFENKSDYVKLKRDVVIMAEAGADVTVQPEAFIRVQTSAKVKIHGIKFDGSRQDASYHYFIRFYDATATSLTLDGCEFFDISSDKGVIYCENDAHADSLIVNDCYFHDNGYQAIYFKASNSAARQTCKKLAVTNSTFANTDSLTDYISLIDVRPYNDAATDTIKVIVDHCTFYNNPTKNTDHASIRTAKLSDVTVSNCIFAHPQALDRCATYCTGGGLVTNCIAFNLTHTADNQAQAWGPTVVNCNMKDPLFDDLANNKYSFKGNYTTGQISPARGAATDGSDLGDPRWYTPFVLPDVDFAAPYAFVGQKASLFGRIGHDANKYLLQDNNEQANSAEWGTATWRFHATTGCSVIATLNMSDATTSGHIYKVEIFDANDNSIGSVQESAWDNCTTDKQLGGMIVIPAEGDYRVVLSDLQEWSTSTIKGITLSKVAFYLAGSMTEWGTAKVLMEEVSGNLYKATFSLGGWNEFKLVENDNWHGYGGINKVDSVLSDVLIQNTGDPNYNFGFNLPSGASISTTIYWNNADKKAYVKLDPATLEFNVVGSTTLGLDENPAALVNDMTNNGDGTFTLVKTNVALAASTNYWYKVACYHKWDLNYGDPANTGDEHNMYVNVPLGGLYDITFTFDWNTKTVNADAEVQLVDGYYLMGNNNGYTGEWNISALDMDRLLSLNPGNASEYLITTTLAEGNEFKIVKVQNGVLTTWYPDGIDNNYIVGAGYAGLRTIYFRPDASGTPKSDVCGGDWYKGLIYNSPATYEAGILAHTYATICLPYAATLSNGKFYSVKTAEAGSDEIVIEEQDGTMVAGTPYIISAVNPAAAVVAYLSGEKVAEPVPNGIMIGNLSETPIIVAADANNYILQADQLHLVVAGNPGDKVTVGQYKAYFHTAAALAPSAIRIVEGENNTTNINNVKAKDEVVKFFENGMLFIRRNGVTYDVTGRVK